MAATPLPQAVPNLEPVFIRHVLPEGSRGSRNPENSSSSLLLSGRSRSTTRAGSDINPVVFKNSRRSKGFPQNNPMVAVEVRLKNIGRFLKTSIIQAETIREQCAIFRRVPAGGCQAAVAPRPRAGQFAGWFIISKYYVRNSLALGARQPGCD